MRAVESYTANQDTRAPSADTAPVQRRASLQGLDYATAVQRLAPVQLKEDTANVHSAAQRGTSGGGGSLPYLGQIQKSFGGHDVSGIKSHTGGKASEACESMGAEAYASGQDVAFKGQPDLHTAAHEAAHIVQQRVGVQLSGGVGKAGDPYEKNADEVADRVVQGKSAEDLLGGPTFGGAAAVQRSVQMKGGLLDKLKSYFLEAKLTGPQQKVAKILAEKHGVDVSGLPTSTFASLYKDAGGDNPKQSPDKTAANMASAARDHVGEAKKPTQKKESGVVSGVAVQRKEARNVQRGPRTATVEADLQDKAVAVGGQQKMVDLPLFYVPIYGPLGIKGGLTVAGSGAIAAMGKDKGPKGKITGKVNVELSGDAGLFVGDAFSVSLGSSIAAETTAEFEWGKGSKVLKLTGFKIAGDINAKMDVAGVIEHKLVIKKADFLEIGTVTCSQEKGAWKSSCSGVRILHPGLQDLVNKLRNQKPYKVSRALGVSNGVMVCNHGGRDMLVAFGPGVKVSGGRVISSPAGRMVRDVSPVEAKAMRTDNRAAWGFDAAPIREIRGDRVYLLK